MMNRDEIVGGLRWLKPESGDFVCEGCGWENSCDVRGCRIVREAADMLENDESQTVALQRGLALRQAQLDCAAASSAVLKKQNEQMRDAAAQVTKLAAEAAVERDWISVEDRLPEDDGDVLAIVSGYPTPNITLEDVVVAGGLAVMCALVFLLWWLVEQIYILASNRFRRHLQSGKLDPRVPEKP